MIKSLESVAWGLSSISNAEAISWQLRIWKWSRSENKCDRI